MVHVYIENNKKCYKEKYHKLTPHSTKQNREITYPRQFLLLKTV